MSRLQASLTITGIGVAIATAATSVVYNCLSSSQQQAREHRIAALQEARSDIRDMSNALDSFLDDRRSKGYTDTAPASCARNASFEHLRDAQRALRVALAPLATDGWTGDPVWYMRETADVVATDAVGTKLTFAQDVVDRFETNDCQVFLTWTSRQIADLEGPAPWWQPLTNSDGLPSLRPTPTPVPAPAVSPTPHASRAVASNAVASA